jgi:transcriptional regulator with XRE-family HTH domain
MSPLFRKKKILTQETLGEKFKKVRLGKNWNLQKAAEKARIQARYLSALETSNYNDIPGEIYIKNFIRSYSVHLGIDPGLSLKLYDKEKHIIEHKKFNRCLNEIKAVTFFEKILKPSAIKITSVCLVVFFVLGYLGLSVYKTIAPPALTIFYPGDNTETREFTISVIGKSDPEAQVVINNEAVLLNEDGGFVENIQLREGLNLIVASARGKHSKTRKIIRHILVNPDYTIAKSKILVNE